MTVLYCDYNSMHHTYNIILYDSNQRDVFDKWLILRIDVQLKFKQKSDIINDLRILNDFVVNKN